MKKYEKLETTKKWCSENTKYNSDKFAFNLIDRLEVESEMKTRLHKFTCGTDGEVVDEITVKIKIPRLDIQPHSSFEENVVDHFVREFMICEVAGWLENVDQD